MLQEGESCAQKQGACLPPPPPSAKSPGKGSVDRGDDSCRSHPPPGPSECGDKADAGLSSPAETAAETAELRAERRCRARMKPSAFLALQA